MSMRTQLRLSVGTKTPHLSTDACLADPTWPDPTLPNPNAQPGLRVIHKHVAVHDKGNVGRQWNALLRESRTSYVS